MRGRVWLAAWVGIVLSAAEWAPIPQAVWDMKEDPAKGLKGAVILESRLTFTGNSIRHVERIRILSEGGRDAAEFDEFLPEARDFEGRTVYRDGKVIPFDSRKDFTVKTIKGDDERKVMIPPGVTADCVVELRYSDYATIGEGNLPHSLGYSAEWLIGGKYPILEQVVEFWPKYFWHGTVLAGRFGKPEVSSDGRKYVLRNIPGREAPPYSLRSLAGLPAVLAWRQPRALDGLDRSGGLLKYWQSATDRFWKPAYKDELEKGSIFETFAADLTRGLPAVPAQAASILLRRLEGRIRNVSQPTLAETGSVDIKAVMADTYAESHNLDRIVKRGAASGREMVYLFLALLQHARIESQIALVKDRNTNLFLFDLPNAYQPTWELVGVDAGDGATMWFDPHLRFAQPGLIHPSFQGWSALLIDTTVWKASRGFIPIQSERFNVSKYSYAHTFGEGTRAFTLKAAYSGFPEYRQRRRFMAMSPQEQARTYREALEARIPDCTITSAEVLHATDPDANVETAASGTLETSGGDRLVVDPFPGMPSPLHIPSSWPETRTERIIIEHLGIQATGCEIQVPKGWAVKGTTPFHKENAFGKVFFLVETKVGPGGTVAKVGFRVDVLKSTAPPEDYAAFKEFMGWVDDAYRRQIILEKQ